MKAIRQTVDLSAYPDLVVVYLGMTVNVLTGVKTLCFRCMSGCANTGAILNRLNASHGQNPIVNGVSSFRKTLGDRLLARTLFCTGRF